MSTKVNIHRLIDLFGSQHKALKQLTELRSLQYFIIYLLQTNEMHKKPHTHMSWSYIV